MSDLERMRAKFPGEFDSFGERHPVLAWLWLGAIVVVSIFGALYGFGVIG